MANQTYIIDLFTAVKGCISDLQQNNCIQYVKDDDGNEVDLSAETIPDNVAEHFQKALANNFMSIVGSLSNIPDLKNRAKKAERDLSLLQEKTGTENSNPLPENVADLQHDLKVIREESATAKNQYEGEIKTLNEKIESLRQDTYDKDIEIQELQEAADNATKEKNAAVSEQKRVEEQSDGFETQLKRTDEDLARLKKALGKANEHLNEKVEEHGRQRIIAGQLLKDAEKSETKARKLEQELKVMKADQQQSANWRAEKQSYKKKAEENVAEIAKLKQNNRDLQGQVYDLTHPVTPSSAGTQRSPLSAIGVPADIELRNSALEEKLSEKSEQIEQLQANLADQVASVDDKTRELEDLRKQVEQDKSDADKDFAAAKQDLDEKIDALEKEKVELGADRKKLNDDIAKQKTEYDAQIKQLQSEKADLEVASQTQKETAATVTQNLQDRITELESEKKQQEGELAQLQTEKENLVKQQQDESETKQEELRNRISQLEGQNAELQSEGSNLKDEVKKANDEYEEKTAELQRQIDQLNIDKAGLNATIKQQNAENDGKLRNLETQIKALEEEKKQLQDAKNKIETAANKTKDDKTKLQDMIKDKEAELKGLRRDKATTQERIRELEQQELNDKRKTISVGKTNLTGSDTDRQVDDVRAVLHELNVERQRAMTLDGYLTTAQARADDLQTQLNEANGEVQKLKDSQDAGEDSLATEQGRVTDLQAQLEAAKARADGLQNQLSQAEAKIERLEQAQKAASDSLTTEKERVADLQDELGTADTAIKNTQSKLDELQKAHNDLSQSHHVAEETLKTVQDELEEAKTQRKTVEADLRDKEKDCLEKDKQCKDLESKLKQAQEVSQKLAEDENTTLSTLEECERVEKLYADLEARWQKREDELKRIANDGAKGIDGLTQTDEELEKFLEETITQLRKLLADVQTKLDDSKKRLDVEEKTNAGSVEANADLEKRLDALREHETELKKALQECKDSKAKENDNDNDSLQTKARELAAWILKEVGNSLEEIEKIKQYLMNRGKKPENEDDSAELKKQLQRCRDEHDRLEAEVARLNGLVAERDTRVTDLQTQIIGRDARITNIQQAAEETRRALQGQINIFEKTQKDITDRIRQMNENLNVKARDYDNKKRQIERAEKEIQKYIALVSVLRAERDRLQDALVRFQEILQQARAEGRPETAPNAGGVRGAVRNVDWHHLRAGLTWIGNLIRRWEFVSFWVVAGLIFILVVAAVSEGMQYSAWRKANAHTRGLYMAVEDQGSLCLTTPRFEYFWHAVFVALLGRWVSVSL